MRKIGNIYYYLTFAFYLTGLRNNYISQSNVIYQVLCIGLGNPVPTVSLYLDGHLIRSDNQRHLVTTIFNATRVVKKVGCSATNGDNADYSEKNLDIRYHPKITSIKQRNAFHRHQGQMYSVICGVEANPAPTIRFGRTNGQDLKVILISPRNSTCSM